VLVEGDGFLQDRGRFERHRGKTHFAGGGQRIFEQQLSQPPASMRAAKVHLSQLAGPALHGVEAIGADDRAVLVFEDAECAASREVRLLNVVEVGVGAGRIGSQAVLAEDCEHEGLTGSQSALVAHLSRGHIVIAEIKTQMSKFRNRLWRWLLRLWVLDLSFWCFHFDI
jgi:hypothetical protein